MTKDHIKRFGCTTRIRKIPMIPEDFRRRYGKRENNIDQVEKGQRVEDAKNRKSQNSNITASEGRRKTYETSTMGRRVTNFTTLEHRQLTLDPLSSLLCRSDDVQSTNTFAI